MSRKHLLLTPGPFFGHYIPMLEFAKKIVEYHNVTILMVESKIAKIRARKITPLEPIKLTVVSDGLTLDLDTDFSLPAMAQVMRHLGPLYADYIARLPLGNSAGANNRPAHDWLEPVDVVIGDWFLHTVFQACHRRCIPVYAISFLPPALTLNLASVNPETPTVPDGNFTSGKAPVRKGQFAIPESIKDIHVECNLGLVGCRGLLMSTFRDLDVHNRDQCYIVSRQLGIPIEFVGPFIPTTPSPPTALTAWLNRQKENSVVYVSFGSIGTLSPAQLEEIGKALLSLKKPFVWALREFQQQHLPRGFQAPKSEHLDSSAPYLILPWVPQKEVLGHPATAVFVSHCGWNSVSEAVYHGVPIVGWSLFGDQPANAVMVENLGIGLKVGDTGLFTDTVVGADTIERLIQKVAAWDEDTNMEFVSKAGGLSKLAKEAVGPDGESSRTLRRIMQNL